MLLSDLPPQILKNSVLFCFLFFVTM